MQKSTLETVSLSLNSSSNHLKSIKQPSLIYTRFWYDLEYMLIEHPFRAIPYSRPKRHPSCTGPRKQQIAIFYKP